MLLISNEICFVGIRRITRDFPPAHFLFKVEAFSLLAKTGVEKYESDAFEASGYKWCVHIIY